MRLLLFSLIAGFLSITAALDWNAVRLNTAHRAAVDPHIIGGKEVAEHSCPYQVGVLINGGAFCGGSLISPNYVLTAAHCGVEIFYGEVILGAHNITNNDEITQVRINIAEVITHEQYNSTVYENDITLLRLESPAPINENIKTVTLPAKTDADNEYFNDTVLATGWGLAFDVTNAGLKDLSPVLKGVNVSVISESECADYYNDYDNGYVYVTEKNLCTSGYKNKGTCNGDSGGPLLDNGVQIGLVSFGTLQCETCAPSAYTKVSKFLDWIEKNSDVVIQ